MPISIETKPYLKTLPTRVALPKGDPIKHGNLVFLMSDNYEESIRMINNTTIFHDNKYQYYYYEFYYTGKIYGKRFIERDLDARKDIYDKISKDTSLHHHPLTSLDKSGTYNTYYDMYEYMQIFNNMTATLSTTNKIKEYWAFIKSIINKPEMSEYHKMMLIDVDYYKFRSGKVKDLMSNPVFIIYYSLYRFYKQVSDIDLDIFLYCNGAILKLNLSECDEKSYTAVKREISKLMAKATPDIEKILDDDNINKEVIKTDVENKIQERYNFVGDTSDTGGTSETKTVSNIHKMTKSSLLSDEKSEKEVVVVAKKNIIKTISNTVSNISDDMMKELSDDVTDDAKEDIIESIVQTELNSNEELLDNLYTAAVSNKVKTSTASSARDQLLREKQKEIKIKDMTIQDIENINATDIKIPETNLKNVLHTSNKNMAISKMTNFEKVYNEKCLNKDIMDVFTCLNKKALPMYVVSTEITDTSNELNYKETWKVVLEDTNRQRHTINVDIPKFYEDKFLYLGGNKKSIVKQNFLFPIVKTAPDTVQIVANYNKMFIRRMGSKSFADIERLTKFVTKTSDVHKYFKFGNVSSFNGNKLSSIEYDELSKIFVEFVGGNTRIYFVRDEAEKNAGSKTYDKTKYMCVGSKNGKPLLINLDTQTTNDDETIIDLIISELAENLQDEYRQTSVGKRLLYNSATIMAQTIPLVSLLGYWEGLTTVLKKANIEYTSFDKKKRVEHGYAVLHFADGSIVYKNTIEAQLLLNGMAVFDTKSYTLDDFNGQIPYIDYFKGVYGKAAIVNTLTNAYEFMIDDITLEILKDNKLPEDIVSLCLHANNMLADNSFTSEGKEWIYRVRSNEIIPAILYSIMSSYYINYRNSGGKHKLSIPKDSVIKQLLALQTVEDYSVLNPVVEVFKTSGVSCKGFRGANLDQAYNEEKRSYDPSMLGIMAMSTSPDANCGINRELTWEPKITNARGYVEITPPDDLKDVNLFSASELVTTMGVTKDDSIRTAMAGKQTRHIIPTKDSCPVLISNGAEEAIKYKLGSDFIVNADEDGTVIEINKDKEMMVVKYISGKYRAVDLSSNIVKNGGGGFYLNNQLITDYKVGDKFKENDTLAYHKDFFTSDPCNGVRMNIGTLTKVAIMSCYNTYQDGSICTKKMSERMASDMIFPDTAVIGKNSDIQYIVKVGDHIEVGEPLIQYDTSFEESELNKFLKNLEDDVKAEINENSRNNIKATHSGVIKDIKMYSTVELDEMSDSLRAVVEKYYSGIIDRKKLLEKYDKTDSVVKCGVLFTDTTGKITPNAYGIIKGNKVEDGILIEFYIEHGDELGVGDKAVLFTANKVVIDELIPEGFEPYSELHPDEEVSVLMGESAILKRMIPSVVLSVLGNKVLVELKRKLQDIYMK